MALIDRLNRFNEAHRGDQAALIASIEERNASAQARIYADRQGMQALIDGETDPVLKAELQRILATTAELLAEIDGSL